LTLLAVKNLSIPYSKNGELPSFSFELNAPALVFITGSNGIGKSTFLKQLSGSIPSKQQIFYREKDIDSFSLKEKAGLIGCLEQHHTISFPLVVKDMVVMGCYRHKPRLAHYDSKDYLLVKEALSALGIDYLYEKNFLHLSGGEQQLCLLAQLSLQDPDFILLDEPTQNLDFYNKGKVFEWMEKQVSEKGKTVICITHDLHWISNMKGYMLALNSTLNALEPLSEERVTHVIEALKRNTL